jgi:hypothetical protein
VSPNKTVGTKGESDREQPECENPPHNDWGKGKRGGERRAKEDRRWRNGDWVESKRNDEPAADYFAIIIERKPPWVETNRAENLTFRFFFFGGGFPIRLRGKNCKLRGQLQAR